MLYVLLIVRRAFCSILTNQSALIPVLEEVARLQVRLDDVNSFLFTHHLNKEPMVFYVPNKAVRNSLKLHVNVRGRAVSWYDSPVFAVSEHASKYRMKAVSHVATEC